MQCKLVKYHYTYAPCPIPGNICIIIRIAQHPYLNQVIHHNLCMLFVLFLVSLPARQQPQDYFLMPGATTFWTYTCSTHEAPIPRARLLVPRATTP
jgi:hypothetical protein